MSQYEAVIGLEVHVQLATKSKLFCSCSTQFGQPANSNVCEVCSGQPGALPRVNAQAVHYAVLVGLATHCHINQKSVFARKNYFYPDLPSGYQISQFELPICEHGYLDVPVDGEIHRIGITRIHMENDAGKNIHAQGENISLVDLNRAGTPLVEIVSEPDMHSPEEVVAYLKALHSIVTYLGISDGNMEEGSFRCDANVSLHKKGTPLGTRAELKNVNSFKNVYRAIEYEIERQRDLLDDGEKVIQETRLYDAEKNCTASMRGKEEAHDYRYFPDPDILPVLVSDEQLSAWKQELPEMPQERLDRFTQMTKLPPADAEILVSSRAMADFFEEAAKNADPRKVANFILGPLQRELNSRNCSLADTKLSSKALANLVNIVENGLISAKIANDVFPELLDSDVLPEELVKNKGLVQISDTGELEGIVDAVIAENPKEVEAYRGGKKKLIGFFMGQIMRQTKGKANPATITSLLEAKLA